jgi:hypothetical protein
VEHFRDEFDDRRPGREALVKDEREEKGTIGKGRIGRANDEGMPVHEVIGVGRGADAVWRVLLEPLKIAHEAATGWSRHLLMTGVDWDCAVKDGLLIAS